jgi:hypothetical protein
MGANMRQRWFWPIIAITVQFFILLPARAELGGRLGSIPTDEVRMQARRHLLTTAHYSVHELSAASGTVIREFVSPGGQVFAVSWTGPWRPNLQQLFGAYYDQFLAARENSRAVRGALSLRLPDLVVHFSGHQRAAAGYAFVPALVPVDINPGELFK